ncbi:MAG: amidohydrolase family protein [Lentisphaeria bacterium]|nr:amidohydrolase family protein [Lentisphaeria bacterium]
MVELIDVQAGFGGLAAGVREGVSAEELVAELRRHRISRAVTRITPDGIDFDAVHSNETLYEACRKFPELIPCPIVLPAQCGDVPPESEQVSQAIEFGAGAVVLRPGPDQWLPERWVAKPLLEALQAACLPVVCLFRLVPLPLVAAMAQWAPKLPLIVAEVPYNQNRNLVPLLQTFPNVHLSLGNNFTAHRGIEFYVEKVGADRLLFGTGLPTSEAGASIGQFLYSDLTEENQRKIGAGNFLRLQEGICR